MNVLKIKKRLKKQGFTAEKVTFWHGKGTSRNCFIVLIEGKKQVIIEVAS